MKRIVLSTSSSSLDNLAIKTNIRLIRLRIYVNNVEFIDGKNINVTSLTAMMTQSASHSPVYTKPAPANEVAEMLTQLENEGYKEVFITTLSSVISESYAIIKKVADSFKGSMNIHVYDTKELNICEAMLALEAEQMLAQGHSMDNIVTRLDGLRARHTMLFPIDDLSYMIKNKKLSSTAGFFANLFSIKPVLQMTLDGSMIPFKKIRKYDKAINEVIESFADNIQRPDTFAYALSTGRPKLDKYFVELVKKRTHIKHLPVLPVSAISLANHGPTGTGLCAFIGDKPSTSHLLMNL